MPPFPRLPVTIVTAFTAVLRAPGLFLNRFQPDEALFATWAREIAVWRDPLLQMQPVDKPPLLFYGQALFFPLFGPVEFAARWPNWIASVLLVPLTAVLAWKLYRAPGTAVLAAVLVALFPLSIQFSPTAFTDPLLVFWTVAGLTALVDKKRGVSGFLFGLALLTKYQAVLFFPLYLGVVWIVGWGLAEWRRWLAGWLLPFATLLIWEIARSGRLLLWPSQINNFGGVRLSWSWELWPRFLAWVDLWQTAVSSVVYLLLIPALGWFLVQHVRPRATLFLSSQDLRQERVDKLLAIFVLGYGLFHWLWAIPAWDRYLLPLMPFLALLLARAYGKLLASLPPPAHIFQFRGAALFLLLVLISASWPARNGRFPLGSFPQADRGAADVAAVLADAPYGTVLYDHWFSWQWRYYFFDKRVFISWFSDGAALATDLKAFGGNDSLRYLALPVSPRAQPIVRAVHNAGFSLTAVAHSDQIILYKIAPVMSVKEHILGKVLKNSASLWPDILGRYDAAV